MMRTMKIVCIAALTMAAIAGEMTAGPKGSPGLPHQGGPHGIASRLAGLPDMQNPGGPHGSAQGGPHGGSGPHDVLPI
jgi:hypothetical protein